MTTIHAGTTEPRIAPPSSVSAATESPVAPKSVGAAGEPSPFARILHGLGHQIQSGETMMHTAVASAHDMGPAELISLQAGVYRYSEAIDLASRLVDHATSGVKTVLQGGGQ
jgi:hypothetical protein